MCIKKILLFLILSSNLFAFGQESVYQGERKYSSNQIQNDFIILVSTIKEYHPSVYNYITTDSLENYITKTTAKLNDSLTENEFHIIVREFLMQIRCGHTVAQPSEEWYVYHKSNPKLLPFEIFLFNDSVFIKTSLTENTDLQPGVELISIDNIPIKTIIDQMKSIQPRDGFSESFVNYKIEKSFRTYYLFLYGQKASYIIACKDENDKIKSVTVEAESTKQPPSDIQIDSTLFTVLEKTTWSNFYIANKKSDLAFIDINTFGRKKYNKYYKKVFKEIRVRNINYLVIDIRDNGGGYFLNGNYLLSYLNNKDFTFTFNRPKRKLNKEKYIKMDFFSKLTKSAFNLLPDREKNKTTRNYELKYKPQKKNHYNGTLYVITNSGSFSMSSFVAAYLKHQTDAILIGQETGGGEDGSNAILSHILTLPATKIRVHIPFYHLDHKMNNTLLGNGVMPDIQVKYNIEDILQKKDKEMEELLLLINK